MGVSVKQESHYFSGGSVNNNISELNQYCKEYGIEEDSALHRSMADAIRKGYVILEKSIGYDAEALVTLLYELAKIDSNVIILGGED